MKPQEEVTRTKYDFLGVVVFGAVLLIGLAMIATFVTVGIILYSSLTDGIIIGGKIFSDWMKMGLKTGLEWVNGLFTNDSQNCYS